MILQLTGILNNRLVVNNMSKTCNNCNHVCHCVLPKVGLNCMTDRYTNKKHKGYGTREYVSEKGWDNHVVWDSKDYKEYKKKEDVWGLQDVGEPRYESYIKYETVHTSYSKPGKTCGGTSTSSVPISLIRTFYDQERVLLQKGYDARIEYAFYYYTDETDQCRCNKCDCSPRLSQTENTPIKPVSNTNERHSTSYSEKYNNYVPEMTSSRHEYSSRKALNQNCCNSCNSCSIL